MNIIRAITMSAVLIAILLFSDLISAQPRPSDSLAERVKQLETKVNLFEAMGDANSQRIRSGFATLDCETHRFGTVQSDDPARLLILVSCMNLEPYLEGYRITLEIGNPYIMTLAVMRGTLYYGERSFLDNKVEIPLAQGLRPGFWTRTVVSISRATAAQMRNLRADFYVEQVALSR